MNAPFKRNSLFCMLGAAVAFVGTPTALQLTPISATAQAKPARRVPASLDIYRGEPLNVAKVSIMGWGNGTITEDKSLFYSGDQSLKIITRGLYQGAGIMLEKPANLAPFITNKFAYLVFAIQEADPNATTTTTGGRGSGAPGGDIDFGSGSPFGPGGRGGSGNPFGPGGSGGSGNPFGPGGRGGSGSGNPFGSGRGQSGSGNREQRTVYKTQINKYLEKMRVVMVTTTGKKLEAMLPVDIATVENGWQLLAIPVGMIPGISANDGSIKEFRMFGDTIATFNLGSITVVEDQNPIEAVAIGDKQVVRLEQYAYRASANAGVTPLVFKWDWDSADGIQAEAEGRIARHAYRKETAFDQARDKITKPVVTITISDYYGVKKPVTLTFKVFVAP